MTTTDAARAAESDAAFVERIAREAARIAANPVNHSGDARVSKTVLGRLIELARRGAQPAGGAEPVASVTFVEATEVGWYAVTQGNPHFCMYGKTQQEAQDQAEKAFAILQCGSPASNARRPCAAARARPVSAEAEAIASLRKEWTYRMSSYPDDPNRARLAMLDEVEAAIVARTAPAQEGGR